MRSEARAVADEGAVRAGAAGVHDPLGDALVVEVGDLLAQVVVLQEGRPARPGAQRVVGVAQPGAGRRREEGALLAHAGGDGAEVGTGGGDRGGRLLLGGRGQRLVRGSWAPRERPARQRARRGAGAVRRRPTSPPSRTWRTSATWCPWRDFAAGVMPHGLPGATVGSMHPRRRGLARMCRRVGERFGGGPEHGTTEGHRMGRPTELADRGGDHRRVQRHRAGHRAAARARGLHVVLTGRAAGGAGGARRAECHEAGGARIRRAGLDVRDDRGGATRVVSRGGRPASDAGSPSCTRRPSSRTGTSRRCRRAVMSDVVATNVLGTDRRVSRPRWTPSAAPAPATSSSSGRCSARSAAPYMSSYVLSKWAVHGLVRTLQIEARHREGVGDLAASPRAASTPRSTGRRPRCSGGTARRQPRSAPPTTSRGRVWWVLRHPRRRPTSARLTCSPSPGSGCSPRLRRPGHPAPAHRRPRRHGGDLPRPTATSTTRRTPLHRGGPECPSTTPSRPRCRRSVDAPAEAVWDVLADGWQYATWVVGASRVRAVDPGGRGRARGCTTASGPGRP